MPHVARRCWLLAAIPVIVISSGCSGRSKTSVVTAATSAVSTTPSTVATTPAPSTTVAPPPHFDTPEAAMAYLAQAWNANDLVSERHVTDPGARVQLDAMRSEALNLRLEHCDKRPQGDYECTFRHDYPPGTSTTIPGGIGEAVFLVGPADTPGWYMTVFERCG